MWFLYLLIVGFTISCMLFPAAVKHPKKDKSNYHGGVRLVQVRVCLEELMDTPTFKRFNTVVDLMMDAAEDMDLASIRGMMLSSLTQQKF